MTAKHRKASRQLHPAALLALAVLLAPTPALRAAEIVRGPYLQALLEDSVKVLWTTDAPSRGRVRFAKEGEPFATVDEAVEGTRHEFRLAGLAAETSYRYEVLDGDQVLASDLGFRTPPPAGTGTLRAAVIGDSGNTFLRRRNREKAQRSVTELVESLEPDLFLHTGDLRYVGTIDEVVFSEYRNLLRRVGVTAARGNHSGIKPAEWLELFSPPEVDREIPPCELPEAVCDEDPPAGAVLPAEPVATFYSFDHGPAHFAVVDSNSDLFPCSAQLKWLCADLRDAKARGMPWLILVLHEPPYTTGLHSVALRPTADLLPPIVDLFEVDLVLCGHDHNYQRTHPVRGGEVVDGWQEPDYRSPRGTIYTVTGGGGTWLYQLFEGAPDERLFSVFREAHHAVELELTATRLDLRALVPGGEVIDEITIDKEAPRPLPGFLRGDASFDGGLDITDAVAILRHLFLAEELRCPPARSVAGDANRSGNVDLADAVYLLEFLFRAGNAPPAPFAGCEPVPGFDDTSCLRSSCRVGG